MNSAGIAQAQVIALRLLLILVHFHGFAHISSCAFKEQDLAARQAVAFAVGEKRGEESWELISLLLCIADCFVCSVDACLSPSVLITSYQFQEMGQMCTKEFVFCVTADFFFPLTVKWLAMCWMCCLKWKNILLAVYNMFTLSPFGQLTWVGIYFSSFYLIIQSFPCNEHGGWSFSVSLVDSRTRTRSWIDEHVWPCGGGIADVAPSRRVPARVYHWLMAYLLFLSRPQKTNQVTWTWVACQRPLWTLRRTTMKRTSSERPTPSWAGTLCGTVWRRTPWTGPTMT